MAHRAHYRHYYAVRAQRHHKAARAAHSASDREGHEEVARGFHMLARGGRKEATFHFRGGEPYVPHHRGGKKKGRGRGRRRDKHGRFI